MSGVRALRVGRMFWTCEMTNTPTLKIGRMIRIVWIIWSLMWLGDGLCTYSMSCTATFSFTNMEERRMAGLLALMLSGFPLSFYIPAVIADISKHGSYSGVGPIDYICMWIHMHM